MMFLDTNAIIWLYQGNLEIFPDKLKERMETEDLYVSPVVKLELQYLFEVGRTKVKAARILIDLYGDIGLSVHSVSLESLIDAVIEEDWTRDPFDRMIVGHAKLLRAELVTKDESILRHYSRARWS